MPAITRKLLAILSPAMLFATALYLMVILGDWFTIYYKDPTNPLLLFAYISMIHLVSLPILLLALKGRSAFPFYVFIFLNACWLLMVVIAVALVYSVQRE